MAMALRTVETTDDFLETADGCVVGAGLAGAAAEPFAPR